MTHENHSVTIYTCPMHPEIRQDSPGNCPKCGMTLIPEGTAQQVSHGHHGNHHPAKPSSAAEVSYDKVPKNWNGPIYICPMHAQVRQTEPGSCPICGMGLERDAASAADDAPNPELVDFTRRMWVGTALTLPLLVLTMGPLVGLGWLREIFGERPTMWIELVLGTPVVLWCGWPFLHRGWV